MLNLLVETKKEYTIQLSNLIYFKIYEGINALYKRSITKTTEEEVLRNFQKLLKKIPKWENNFIINEATRVTANSNELINNLLKAIIKANYIILTYDPKKKIKKMDFKNITSYKFIHQVYIQCARSLWDNPFLFYHKFPPIELKRNQREVFLLIKESVSNAIRKLLPIKDILEIYLDNTYTPTEVVDKLTLNQNIVNNELIPKLVNPIINQQLNEIKQNNPLNNQLNNPSNNQLNNQLNNPLNNPLNNQLNNMKRDNIKDTIQSILERNNVNISDSNKINNNFIKKIHNNESIEKNKINNTKNQSLDSRIKNILEKDLNESDIDISLSYQPEKTENYQEVFGNENNNEISKKEDNHSIHSINTMEKAKLMKKNKFFNNYLNF